jgi:hypothetical protein
MTCLFGGKPHAFSPVEPILRVVPARGVRVIPGAVWWRLVYWSWRRFRAGVLSGMKGISAPRLAPPGALGLYFTDRLSLEGCSSPADFALRMALPAQSQLDCQLYGCAVIEFEVPPGADLVPLPELPGAQPGLTGGGGREWLLADNLALDPKMDVHYVETPAGGGPPHYRLPL